MISIVFIKYRFINTIVLLLLLTTQVAAQDLQEIKIANEYLSNGENEKALDAYTLLAKNSSNIASIHSNYFNLLLTLAKFKQAENYIEKLLKKENKFSYQIDLFIVYYKGGDQQKADKFFKSLLKVNGQDIYRMKMVADYLSSFGLQAYATEALLQARTVGGPGLFTLELANLYRIQGKRELMVNEYLNYTMLTPGNGTYIKNLLQMLLSKPEELETLERVLYERVQQNQESESLGDLLIWVNLQQKNFYNAFVQARAFDKRFKKEHSKTLEIGHIALNNHDYNNAIKCFSFVAKEYQNTDDFLPALFGIVKSKQAKVTKSFPVNTDSVKYLISEYKALEKKYPDQPITNEAYLNAAMLNAYYLNQLDSAVSDLSKLISNPITPPMLKAQCKINLGDIYLLKNEPWESTLLYSQVEKSQHEAPLGYEAKLRNAKLWYYAGDFKLAEEHLDILKQATTREIANDAMDLSMRIKENITFDTTGAALKEFAAIELLIYQNKLNEAVKHLDSFDPKESPRILDDVYWLEANLLLKQGKFLESIAKLQKILDEFADDILADDAYFLQGDIYEQQLKNKNKAMEIYREFLNKYPGSVYAAEARKRYRMLRGDFAPVPNQ